MRKFAKFTGKHLFSRCFPVNFAKILRTPFFTEHPQATTSDQSIFWCSSDFMSQTSVDIIVSSHLIYGEISYSKDSLQQTQEPSPVSICSNYFL